MLLPLLSLLQLMAEILGTSTRALPLGGSATAQVLVQATSSGALPMGGSATATVLVQASSSAGLPLGGSSTATVLVQAVSNKPLPLGGSAAATVLVQSASTQALPLAGTAQTQVLVQATSVRALPLAGTAAGTVATQSVSTGALPLSGSATAAVLVQASSAGALPLSGTAAGTTGAGPEGPPLEVGRTWAVVKTRRTWNTVSLRLTYADIKARRTWSDTGVIVSSPEHLASSSGRLPLGGTAVAVVAGGTVDSITGVTRQFGRDDGSTVEGIAILVTNAVGSSFVVEFVAAGGAVASVAGTFVSSSIILCFPPVCPGGPAADDGTLVSIRIGAVTLANAYRYLPAADSVPDFYEDAEGSPNGAVYRPKASDPSVSDPNYVNLGVGCTITHSTDFAPAGRTKSLKCSLVPDGGGTAAAAIRAWNTAGNRNGATRPKGIYLVFDLYTPAATVAEFAKSGQPGVPGSTCQNKFMLYRVGSAQPPDGGPMLGGGADFGGQQLRSQDDATTGNNYLINTNVTIADTWVRCVTRLRRDTVAHLGHIDQWFDGKLLVSPAAHARYMSDTLAVFYQFFFGSAYAEITAPVVLYVGNISAHHGCPV